MYVKIPCDEKFLRQYYRDLDNSEALLCCLDLLLGDMYAEVTSKIAEHLEKDDGECNFLLFNSFFTKDGESEPEFLGRYENTINYTAKKGNPISQFVLAESYEDDGDTDKSFKYYQLSSKKHFTPSMTNAGIKLIYGIGCAKDTNKGLELVNKAKELKDDIAEEFLEFITGKGVNG